MKIIDNDNIVFYCNVCPTTMFICLRVILLFPAKTTKFFIFQKKGKILSIKTKQKRTCKIKFKEYIGKEHERTFRQQKKHKNFGKETLK